MLFARYERTRREVRALRELQRQTSGGYVFETERGTPFSTDAVNRLVKRLAAVTRRARTVSLVLQDARDQFADVGFVVNDQDVGCHGVRN